MLVKEASSGVYRLDAGVLFESKTNILDSESNEEVVRDLES